MDDTLRLAQAVLIDGEMTRPELLVKFGRGPAAQQHRFPGGRWTVARIIDCSIYVKVPDGFYFGTVRYQPEGAQYLTTQTFQELLIEGWTTIRFRDEVIAADAREAEMTRKKKRLRTVPPSRRRPRGEIVDQVAGAKR